MSEDFVIGEKVRVVALPDYVKTADTMPMLRPPSVIAIGQEGIVISRNPGNTWSIRFDNGSFLLDGQYLESVGRSTPSDASSAHLDN
jgi:hypothetical protein